MIGKAERMIATYSNKACKQMEKVFKEQKKKKEKLRLSALYMCG